MNPANIAIRPGAPEGERVIIVAPSGTINTSTWRLATSEDMLEIGRVAPEVLALASGEAAKAVESLQKETAGYRAAKAAGERELAALTRQRSSLEALGSPLAEVDRLRSSLLAG